MRLGTTRRNQKHSFLWVLTLSQVQKFAGINIFRHVRSAESSWKCAVGFVRRNSAIFRTHPQGGSKDSSTVLLSFEPPCGCVRKIAELRRTKPAGSRRASTVASTVAKYFFRLSFSQPDSKFKLRSPNNVGLVYQLSAAYPCCQWAFLWEVVVVTPAALEPRRRVLPRCNRAATVSLFRRPRRGVFGEKTSTPRPTPLLQPTPF